MAKVWQNVAKVWHFWNFWKNLKFRKIFATFLHKKSVACHGFIHQKCGKLFAGLPAVLRILPRFHTFFIYLRVTKNVNIYINKGPNFCENVANPFL